MAFEPRCHSQSGGSRGTEGRGRTGTAAAEKRFLEWTGGVLSVPGVEEVVTAGTEEEPGTQSEMGLLLYFGCWGFGIGQRDGLGRHRARGRDVGHGRGEEAGGETGRPVPAAAQRLGRDLEECGGRKLLTGAVKGSWPETVGGGRGQRPGSVGVEPGSGAQLVEFGIEAEKQLQCGDEVGAGTGGQSTGDLPASGVSCLRFGGPDSGPQEKECGMLSQPGSGSGT